MLLPIYRTTGYGYGVRARARVNPIFCSYAVTYIFLFLNFASSAVCYWHSTSKAAASGTFEVEVKLSTMRLASSLTLRFSQVLIFATVARGTPTLASSTHVCSEPSHRCHVLAAALYGGYVTITACSLGMPRVRIRECRLHTEGSDGVRHASWHAVQSHAPIATLPVLVREDRKRRQGLGALRLHA